MATGRRKRRRHGTVKRGKDRRRGDEDGDGMESDDDNGAPAVKTSMRKRKKR